MANKLTKEKSRQPRIYTHNEQKISLDEIDRDALYVLERLRKAGFIAYLVGGSVRDLLVNKKPKDYDISTSAKPEEIKRLFKNAILIGRRFRLAHLRFGKKVLEVSTFRSGNIQESDLIVRDNEWGDPEEDVLRRDFTINGLFYNTEDETVIDYVGGCEDISSRILKTIGNPILRFKQDPVRMIRLIKFRARFNFDIESETAKALQTCREEILKSSPARIMEEILRMLESGAAEPFFRLLVEHQFLDLLLPWLNHFLTGAHKDQVYSLLRAADELNLKRFHSNRPPLFRNALFSCLLYPILEQEIQIRLVQKGKEDVHLGDLGALILDLIEGMVHSSFPGFPRRMRGTLFFILQTQFRFTPIGDRNHRHSKRATHQDEFIEAMQFLEIRAKADPKLDPIYQQWHPFLSQTVPTKQKNRSNRSRHKTS